MRLRVNFGLAATKEIHWYRSLDDFPHFINFLGKNYEWFMYDKDRSGNVDMILTYSELPSYDPNYNIACVNWADLTKDEIEKCDCGAKFSSFSWDHMRFCKKWVKW